jgi:hypothetical protein
MALQILHTSQQTGAESPSAYARIINGQFNKDRISFTVGIWYDATSASNNLQPLDQLWYELPMPTTASVTGLYNYLKSLPEFTGAIDV